MFTTFEVEPFLPDIVIATPDKLLYEATVQKHETYRIGLFGAPVRRCTLCGRACPDVHLQLKPDAMRCQQFHRNAGCPGTTRGPIEVRPIRYMGFDEVHSLYGVTATYLSMFLASLQALQVFLSQRREGGQNGVGIRFETATATISNETELIEALTRRRQSVGEILLIPAEGQAHDYFQIVNPSVRHRVLVTLPTRTSSKRAFIQSILNAYEHLHGQRADLEPRLASMTPHSQDWRFLLGYLFKKQEGADMRRALRDMYRNTVGDDLRVEFLSGEAPKDQISNILTRALQGEIDILLANLVISLGVDIHGLNHMVMLGMTQSFTEFVQTAGRTGRGLRSSGHVHVILQPFNPRDAYVYRHFHAVLSDVSGYYDVLPVKSTNLFCAGEMFGNIVKATLVGLCFRPQRPRWPNAIGVRDALGGRDAQIRGGLAGLLCDDPQLLADTRDLVDTRFRALMDQLSQQNAFLSAIMTAPTSDWLIRSLRGRPGNVVRVTCADDALLARLRAPEGGQPEDELGDDTLVSN
ncbi:MAG TPA: helicase-related protein [Archangium sp.]|uniref:helicase-related protein n=1 Tax=Archangium sp. TaxID=1872627 RepID=UPI002E2EAABC|nr:helicase-related protein [Archangium sp.]HEX5750060.1 helicase-related protein [Archangium sp.]